MSSKKRKMSSLPKVRHTWKIRPETRIKPSGKIYRREKGKKKPLWVNLVDWFGDEKV